MQPEPSPPRQADSFWCLLYRYIWPFHYFRDVTRGTRIQRQQNYRHNRAMRVHLPGFMAKWTILSMVWFSFGGVLSRTTDLTLPAAGCFVTATGSLILVMLLAVSWVWLERFPELYDQ